MGNDFKTGQCQVIGRASADGQSTSRAFRPGSAVWSKYHLRAGQRLLATHHCHRIRTARPGLILSSPAPGRGLRHRSLRPRPTPPVPPGPLLPQYLMGTDGHGSAGLPEISEYRAESVLLYLFYVCGAALCFSLHRNCGVQNDLYRSDRQLALLKLNRGRNSALWKLRFPP